MSRRRQEERGDTLITWKDTAKYRNKLKLTKGKPTTKRVGFILFHRYIKSTVWKDESWNLEVRSERVSACPWNSKLKVTVRTLQNLKKNPHSNRLILSTRRAIAVSILPNECCENSSVLLFQHQSFLLHFVGWFLLVILIFCLILCLQCRLNCLKPYNWTERINISWIKPFYTIEREPEVKLCKVIPVVLWHDPGKK